MKQPPFNDFLGQYLVQILSPRREAAFLYDAVKLYSKSLKETLENGEDVFNGTRIIEKLKNRSYTRYKTFGHFSIYILKNNWAYNESSIMACLWKNYL